MACPVIPPSPPPGMCVVIPKPCLQPPVVAPCDGMPVPVGHGWAYGALLGIVAAVAVREIIRQGRRRG